MNNVILIGRLTRDPELRYTQQTNTAVARFTVAVDRQNGKKEADFIGCKAFGKTAEVIDRYMSKGRQIAIEGRIQTGNYKDKDGRTVYTTAVIVNRVEFIGSRNDNNDSVKADDTDNPAISDAFNAVDDDIPF